MSGPFPYNTTNGQATAATATGFYHVPDASEFQLQHYAPAVSQNGSLTSSPTAFTDVGATRVYQQLEPAHGTMQNHIGHFQPLDNRMTIPQEDDLQSIDSDSESRTPTQSDQLSAPSQSRKRRRGVIEKRRRDRINSSLAELRRLVPAAFEKQGSQKLEKAEILQMTVDHLRFLSSKGFDSLWRDQQRYSTEYYSMGFRVCIGEVDTFLSKEGMDIHDPLRLRLMSHLQCAGVQRQSAFSVWTNTNTQQHVNHYQHPHQPSYWTPTAASPASTAAGIQYAVYGVIPPPSDMVYASQTLSTVPTTSGTQQDGISAFKNGFVPTTSTCAPTASFANGNGSGFAPVIPVSTINNVNGSNGSSY